MRRYRWINWLCGLLIIPFLVDASFAVNMGDMRIIEGVKTEHELYGRGRWSKGAEDIRLDLTGLWTAVRSDGFDLGEIHLPFSWDGWKGEITLSRSFTIPDYVRNFTYRLVVEGVSEYIAVTLNGAHLDTRRGDNIHFQIEIDPRLLRFESDSNTIEIILDNKSPRNSGIPLSGGLYSRRRYGGLYRDIYILCTPLAAISDMEVRWVDDEIDTDEGHLVVDAELRNLFYSAPDSIEPSFRFEYSLLDPTGNILISDRQENIVFPAGGVLDVSNILKPSGLEMWNVIVPPGLYTVQGQLIGPEIVHSSAAAIGIRSIKLTSDGFLLNGNKLWLRCVNYSELIPGHGTSLDEEQIEQDLRKMKELGIHAVRIVQGSTSLYFLDLCDRLGMLVFEELPVFQVPDPILDDSELIRSASEQLEAMINRDRRFTCIAGWGIGAQINAPNSHNDAYYQQLTQLARKLDNRPVYASISFVEEFTAAPLDFAILVITPYLEKTDKPLPNRVKGDRPVLISGLQRAVFPGNLGGYADPKSEAGQADYLLNMIRQTEQIEGCMGVVIGDFADWEGAVPSISSPLRGSSYLYTTGICDSERNPRLAFHRIKEYWASGKTIPLARGSLPEQDGELIIIVGLGLIIVLFLTVRRNKIFRLNLVRTFTSPKSFFHSIGDRRYFQTGQTIFVALMISGGFGLLGAGWFHSQRVSYPLDWTMGYLLSDTGMLKWMATVIWQPARGLAFFWGLGFISIWLGAVRTVILCRILGKRCTFAQGIAFITWSMAGFLAILPVGMLSQRLFDLNMGWFICLIIILLAIWTHQRLIAIIGQHVNRSNILVTTLWLIGPVIVVILLFTGLEYTRHIFDYWGFFWGTIVQ
ncbi:hypothetical protein HQ587_10915 [bacterium]|nr:hypothetical protein [bacterium]